MFIIYSIVLLLRKVFFILIILNNIMSDFYINRIGDWGLGIGDWGYGIL